MLVCKINMESLKESKFKIYLFLFEYVESKRKENCIHENNIAYTL